MTTLVFDQGQTSTRVVVEHGEVIELPGRSPELPVDANVVRLVREAAAAWGFADVARVVGGATGMFGRRWDLTAALRELADLGTHELVVADDGVTGYLGALGDAEGVVLAAGTGVVAVGSGPAGVARVDGYGAMLGDEGSGWWVGRRGLIAALSARDGRAGGSEALAAVAEARWGDLGALPSLVAAAARPAGLVASFAEQVADVARLGDPVAAGIWRLAGAALGDAIAAAARRAGLRADVPVVVTGRLGGALDLFGDALLDRLASAGLALPVTVAAASPLDGARRLAADPAARQRWLPLLSIASTADP